MRDPAVVIGHDRVDALVEVIDTQRGRAGDTQHDVRSAPGVVRVGDAVRMTEFVQDDGPGEAARVEAFGERPETAAAQVEDADTDIVAISGRILREEAGTICRILGRQQAERSFIRVSRDDVINARDRGVIGVERVHDRVDLVLLPAEGCHRSDAIRLQLAEVLASRGEIHIGRRDAIDVDRGNVRSRIPVERFQRIEICRVQTLDIDRVATGEVEAELRAEVHGADVNRPASFREIAEAAFVVEVRADQFACFIIDLKRYDCLTGLEVEISRAGDTAGEAEVVDVALFDGDRIHVVVTRDVDIGVVRTDREGLGRGEAVRRIVRRIGAPLDERVVAGVEVGQTHQLVPGGQVEVVSAIGRGGEGDLRGASEAAIVILRDQAEGRTEEREERVFESVFCSAVGPGVGLASNQIDSNEVKAFSEFQAAAKRRVRMSRDLSAAYRSLDRR